MNEPLDPIYFKAPVVLIVEGENGTNYAEPVDNYIPLEVFASDKTMFYVVGGTFRTGVVEFGTRLEHEHYRPGTHKNCKYRLVIVNWPQHEPMQWYVVGFPVEDRATAETLAKECGLRFADGIPCLFDNKGQHWFPMDGENVWNLENAEGEGWVTPDDHKRKLQEELNRVDRVVEDSLAVQRGKVNVDL